MTLCSGSSPTSLFRISSWHTSGAGDVPSQGAQYGVVVGGAQVKEERNRLQRARDDEADAGHRSGHLIAAVSPAGSPRLASLRHALDEGAHRIKVPPYPSGAQLPS